MNKLKFKESTGKQKLSEKEQRLKVFLSGENKELLQELDPDSTTRKYGELAVMNKNDLINAIKIHFNIIGNGSTTESSST